MADYAAFDETAIAAAIDAARNHYDRDTLAKRAARLEPFDDGHLSLAAGCISVTVNNNKVCVKLPLGLGEVCLPIPFTIPNGTVAEACIRVCTTWGIPTGVKLTVSVAGHVILEKTFLKC